MADSLAMVMPDSAIALLHQLQPEMATSAEPVRRYYDLLTIKARDKAFISHQSDSLILDVLQYYEQGGDQSLLPEAYYYAGRVTQDLGDSPKALGYYQDALDAIVEACNDTEDAKMKRLSGCIYAQMGYLFTVQGLTDQGYESFRKAYEQDSIIADTISMLMDLRDMGQALQAKGDLHLALDMYREAHRLADEANDKTHQINLIAKEAHALILLDSLSQAHSLISKIEDEEYSRGTAASITFIKALLYSKTEQSSIARDCYEDVLQGSYLVDKSYASLWLAEYYLEQKENILASKYLKLHLKIINQLQNGQNAEHTSRISAFYNYSKQEQARAKLEIVNSNYQLYSVIITAVSFVLLIFLLILLWLRKRKILDVQRQQRRIDIIKAIVDDNDAISAAKKEEQKLFLTALRETNQYSIIRNAIFNKKPLTTEELKGVQDVMLSLVPDFVSKLQSSYSYSEIEWYASLLIKMDIEQKDIAKLLGRSQEGISSLRRRLYKKVFMVSGPANKWDKFIHSL